MEYDERLAVPLRWWVQGTMLLATLWLALVVSVPPPLAWSATVLCVAGMTVFFVSYGGVRIRVAGGVLRAGRAQISVGLLGDVAPLDAEETRRVAGVDADARAYLLLRPYLKRAVQVTLADPADPTPYWLLHTRHPETLAAAMRGATTRLTAGQLPRED